MLPTFTPTEQALVDKWLANETKDVARLNASKTIALTAQAETLTEDAIYNKMKQQALDDLDALLTAKAAALLAANPDPDVDSANEPRTVDYLVAHPVNGGENPAAWEIIYFFTEIDLSETRTVEYSHAVNWDSNPAILAAEAQWAFFRSWQTDTFYGTIKRLDALDGAITSLTAEIIALQARNAELRDE